LEAPIVVDAAVASADLELLIDQVCSAHEPVLIAGEHHRAVLVSEADWRSMQETLSLLGTPGMQASIKEGMREPLSSSAKMLGW